METNYENIPVDDSVSIDFYDPNKCKKCQKKTKIIDDLCSGCLSGTKKCLICKEYYAAKNEVYCSVCKMIKKWDKPVTLDDIYSLPKCSFKGLMLQKNLIDIYERYKKENDFPFTMLLNETKFKALKNICKGKSSKEIFMTLNGNRDFEPTLLPARFADELLAQTLENIPKDNQWKYIHSIGPFIFDVWNTRARDSVFICYYKNMGDLIKCPNDEKELFELWNKSFSKFVRDNLGFLD